VQAQRISAVLCAPLALAAAGGDADAGTIGVLYLEGKSAPGPFSEEDRQLVEIAARSITPLLEKLLERSGTPRHTPPLAPGSQSRARDRQPQQGHRQVR
jgi:hypothetical protein